MQVGIWIRVSTEDQARGVSPKNHEARARMYAELKGWTVVEMYGLSGVSGKSVSEHPEAQRMFADVVSGKIGGLIFSKLARLARNTRELLDFSEFFQKHNANLVSLEESLDTSTPAGRLLYTVIGALAQWEREEISARVAASIPIRARQGKPTGGAGPFGYMWSKERQLVPNPKEAPTVKRAFELYLEIGKLLTTCERLNEEGYRARKGVFKPVTLKRLLTDTVYKGLRRANYSKSKGQKKSWVLKPEKDWVFVQVEPLVDDSVWEKVNALLMKNARHSQKAVPKEGKYLFSGLLVCSCGTKLYVAPYSGMKVPRYVCRDCRFKLNEDVLEEHFQKALKTMIVKPEELKAVTDFAAEQQEKEERLSLLQREIKSVDGKIDTLLDLVGDLTIDRINFTERFMPLKERKEQISLEIPRLQAEIDIAKANSISKNYLLERATNFASMWPILEDDDKRRLVQDLVDKIEIGEDSLHFVLSYNPSFGLLEKDVRNPRGSSPQPA
jgi:site-specific DNA recombinase